MKIVTYSAVCGNRDAQRSDVCCFNNFSKFVLPVMNAKIYKALAHKFVDCDVSVWIDGNISLKIPQEQLVAELLGDNDYALFKHPYRDCVYEEGPAALARGNEAKPEIDEQLAYYRTLGWPVHAGLFECNVLIRRHNEVVNALNEAWWAEICRFSRRDQLSFPIVLAKFRDRLKMNIIQGNIRSHPFFQFGGHIA